MNKYKVLIIALIFILMMTAFGCEKNKNTTSDNGSSLNAKESASPVQQGSDSGTTGSSFNTSSQAVSSKAIESGSSKQGIMVISKSDTTITQAEKKKVLDELSTEVDSLIDEVNRMDSSLDDE